MSVLGEAGDGRAGAAPVVVPGWLLPRGVTSRMPGGAVGLAGCVCCAVWLGGEPHLFLYLGPTRDIEEEELRLAGNTLIWTVGPHTYRLESALDRDAAIAVAETVETD